MPPSLRQSPKQAPSKMSDPRNWQCSVEIHPASWHFPAGKSWIAGWVWSSERRLVTDVRGWVDGRPFLGLWGLPRPEIEQRLLDRPGPPYLGFSLLLSPHAGARQFRLDVRDQTGAWLEVFRTKITVAQEAGPCPPTPSTANLVRCLLPRLLRQQAQRPGAAIAALADEILSAALAEPLNSLPNPPFHGALEDPINEGWLRYGRLSISGWLTHRISPIKRLSAMLDPLQESTLLHGLHRDDVNQPEFHNLPGRHHSAFLGHANLPAGIGSPALLKIFAELENGERHLAFAQRFFPYIASGVEASLPPFSPLLFVRTVQALLASARRHGLPACPWRQLLPACKTAWADYRAEAPASNKHTRLAAPVQSDGSALGPMRVLVISHNLNFEGAPWFIYELARDLARQPGVTVHVASPLDGPLRRVFEEAGMPVQLLDIGPTVGSKSPEEFHNNLQVASASLAWSETDLVIANTMVAFWAVHAARAAGKPSLLYVHESASIRRFFSQSLAPALLPVVEQAFTRATRVVFTADSTRRVHSPLGRRGNFTLLPSWVDAGRIESFKARHTPQELRQKHGLNPEALIVVNIGSICERKGQHVFIQAVELLKEELLRTPNRQIQFVLVGARPGLYLEMLREEVKRHDLGPWIKFMPETGVIFDFYRLADIFCCSSFEESFPRVLLESAVFGLPIISTNVNGIAEMLAPDEAWFTPPGDRYRLAEALRLALADQLAGDRRRADKARATVLRKYHEENSLPLHRALAGAAATGRLHP